MREKSRMRPQWSPIYMFLVQLHCGDSTHYCVDSTHFCVNFRDFQGDSIPLCVNSTDPWKPLLGMSRNPADYP
jgi:hypothetical protein